MSSNNPARRSRAWVRGFPLHIFCKISLALSWGVSTIPLAHSDGMNYSTALAEIRLVPFPDGTELHMDARTSVLIKEGGGRRTAYLSEGQIHVVVQHGKSEPFDIVVHGVLLRDLGTEFNVAAHGDVVTVSVTSGKIQVMELHNDGSQSNPINIKGKNASRTPTYLVPGDLARLEKRDDTILVTRDGNSLDEAQDRTSWIGGRLKTRGERLEEVLWEMNARNKVHLLAGDPTVAQMTIGGNYDLMHVDDFLQSAQSMGLEVDPVKVPEQTDIPTYILRRPADASPTTKRRQ